ncbi:MAG: site-specific integrase [Syntrophales bacterium]|jgi:integrase
MKRFKTEYPGVFYREAGRIGGKGKEKIYYIVFKKDGKVYEEKVGRQYSDNMTTARASRIRADRIEGRRLSRKEIRDRKKSAEQAWTLARLWSEYESQKTASKSIKTDRCRFDKYLDPALGTKQPHEIIKLDVDRLRMKLAKRLKPQTVKHILALLKRIVTFGVRRQLAQGLGFKVEVPQVDNVKTEDLTPEQLKRLLKEIDNSIDIQATNIMRMALLTGMRRGELFKLKWSDIDFDRGFINIRNPKGGVSQKIPLNDPARNVLLGLPRTADHVFVRCDGKPFTDIRRRVNPIKKAAGIPDDFRALHGLRHVYASMLASSGQVDMYTLQKLLTHKDPKMTQRYAHLRDETLKRAADLAGELVTGGAGSGNR